MHSQQALGTHPGLFGWFVTQPLSLPLTKWEATVQYVRHGGELTVSGLNLKIDQFM